MNKSQKKSVLIFLASIVLIGGTILIYTLISNSQSVKASKQLVAAIEDNDLQTVSDIINQNPKSVNTLPSSSPWWLELIAEQPDVYYPLQKACIWGRYEIIKKLINSGADCNLTWKGTYGSKSPLICAVVSESEETIDIIKLLMDNGADKSLKDNRGKTAYDYAIEEGNLELAELLKP